MDFKKFQIKALAAQLLAMLVHNDDTANKQGHHWTKGPQFQGRYSHRNKTNGLCKRRLPRSDVHAGY